MKVRRATIQDLQSLIEFTNNEAKEAEGITKSPKKLETGIKLALEDETKAIYWVLVNGSDVPVGSVSALKEWSDWNSGYYWWIQSMYIDPAYRGKNYMILLLAAVEQEMDEQNGLELRLYVHEKNQAAIKAYKKSNFRDTNYKIMVLNRAT